MKMTCRSGLLLLALSLAACSPSEDSTGSAQAKSAAQSAGKLASKAIPIPARCDSTAFCVGSGRFDLAPTQAHIDGMPETRLNGQAVTQKFHLGGFGFGPFEALGPFNDFISNEAARRPFHVNVAGREERTFARVLYVTRPGSNVELVFAMVDAIGTGNLIQQGMQRAVAAATGVPESHVIIGATHSHAGADLQGLWGGVPEDWVQNHLYAGIAQAALRAKTSARRAKLLYAQGETSDFNNYRRPRRVRGEDADAHLALLLARDLGDNHVIGSLLQYAAHPTIIGTGAGGAAGRAVHGDYIFGAARKLERAFGGTAVFFNGPIADAQPRAQDLADKYEASRLLGEGMADAAIAFFRAKATRIDPEIAIAQREALLPITNPAFVAIGILGAFNRYYDFLMLPFAAIPGIGQIAANEQSNLPQLTPTATTLVSRVTLGGFDGANRLEIVTIPGETTNSFGRYIRSLATTPNMMLFGLTHNSFGYILPEEEFNYVSEDGDAGFVAPGTGYEEFVSLGPLTAPLLRMQAYNPLFNTPPEQNVPPSVASCLGPDPFGTDCFLAAFARRPDFFQKAWANQCTSNGLPEEFCAFMDPQTPLAQPCRNAGLPETICQGLGEGEAGDPLPVSGGSAADCTDGNPYTQCLLPIESLTAVTPGPLLAGVGVVDMTPNVGYCAGQYCDITNYGDGLSGGEIDPFLQSRSKFSSYGVQSRLTARALVVQGANGRRIALLKTDNYLAQDYLMRRVAQILGEGDSNIGYDQILHHVTHDHSSAYYSTPSWGVWAFQDVFDQREFEFQAIKIAEAIELAAAGMKPARLGATTIQHHVYKGNVVRLATAVDGTPAGYPLEYGDHGLTVLRFDDLSNPLQPKPLAVWMNFGEHPESLDGYNLHSADYLAALERFVDRSVGAPLIFSQGDVGSAENSGNKRQLLDDAGAVCGDWPEGQAAPLANACPPGQGVLRDWNHQGFVQTERNVRFLADDVIRAWHLIGRGQGIVPFTTDPVIDYRNAWVPGPVSHPYPSVSNCQTDPTLAGNVGVPIIGLPDCSRDAGEGLEPLAPAFGPLAMAAGVAQAEGVPMPRHYDAASFTAVEENLRLKLQTFRLGEILLASCACEAQGDLILNLESRIDDIENNIYDGFDWACLLPQHSHEEYCTAQKRYYDPARFPTAVPGTNFDPVAIARMRAQVHNDARGWDAPGNAVYANSEPNDPALIWGNFTKEELPSNRGYRIVVGVGHAGDYNGYTVSYREYMNRDHYRKALTAYGPHTADYMVTRLTRMAGAMKGAPELVPEPHDSVAFGDEARMVVASTAFGAMTSGSYQAWQQALPNDIGPAAALTQPADIERFNAATFSWRGGSVAADNPLVRVERELVPGVWLPYAGMAGEVQTAVEYPRGPNGVIATYLGETEWRWTANFEAYSAFPRRLGTTPGGRYRFVVDGHIRQDRATDSYQIVSQVFRVSPWRGIAVSNARKLANGDVAFDTPAAIGYPKSYESPFRFIDDNSGDARICDQCTFRPWASVARVVSASVLVYRADGTQETVIATRSGDSWTAPAALQRGDRGAIRVIDDSGNTNVRVIVR